MDNPTLPPLNYRVDGEGEPVILIHGVGANLQSWDTVQAALSRSRRYKAVRMDLRGHGASSPIKERYSLERFCADVLEIMDREAIERAHVVGFSLGGMIAQCLALNWPERVERLAFLATVAGRTEQERHKVVSRQELLRDGGIVAVTEAARERWFTEQFARQHPERIEARIREMVANDLESYIEAYRVFGESELAGRLHEIRHPTLVLTGEHDVGSNTRMARFMHKTIPDSRLVILPELKHSLLVEAPHIVADHLLAFLVDEDCS